MRISAEGLALIKRFEGYVAHPYRCPAGKLTVGYGHVIEDGESFGEITKQEAESLLLDDLTKHEKAVNALVQIPLVQGQFDALVSFAYNCGDGALKSSTLLRKLNHGDIAGAAEEFPRWCHAGTTVLEGLLNRRKAEQELFLS